jgi:hypothetical protein
MALPIDQTVIKGPAVLGAVPTVTDSIIKLQEKIVK